MSLGQAHTPSVRAHGVSGQAEPTSVDRGGDQRGSTFSSMAYVDVESLEIPKAKRVASRIACYVTCSVNMIYLYVKDLLFGCANFFLEHYTVHVEERRKQEQHLQALYQDFKQPSIGEYPKGWPQLAAFLHSADNFAIFRRFGLAHSRVLLHSQAEIHLLEKRLAELDIADAATGSGTTWRLHTARYEPHWDRAQRKIIKKLQKKLLIYGNLLRSDQKLRALGQPTKESHRSVYHWIIRKKPLGSGQYDWIGHPEDFIPQAQLPKFESSILSSIFKFLFFTRCETSTNNVPVNHFSLKHALRLTKLVIVLSTVGILIVPVFVLLWIPLSRAWVAATMFISVLSFSSVMSLLTKSEVKEVLIGTATYCAVLATFLANTPGITGEE